MGLKTGATPLQSPPAVFLLPWQPSLPCPANFRLHAAPHSPHSCHQGLRRYSERGSAAASRLQKGKDSKDVYVKAWQGEVVPGLGGFRLQLLPQLQHAHRLQQGDPAAGRQFIGGGYRSMRE